MKIDVKVFATSDLRHAPYLYFALEQLYSDGILNSIIVCPSPYYHKDRLVVINRTLNKVNRPYPYAIKLEIRNQNSGEKYKIGFDFQDWSNIFSLNCLNDCKILIKKAYEKKIANLIEEKFDIQLYPMGITQPIKKNQIKSKYIQKIQISNFINKLFYSIYNPSELQKYVANYFKNISLKYKKNNNVFNENVKYKIDIKKPYIFFQVEYYDWLGDGEAKTINNARIKLIRELKKQFKNRFIGGIFSKNRIIENAIDCQSYYMDRSTYLELLNKAAIVISTNGFGKSVPWKIAEYLKLGKCIVSEKFIHETPEPLIDGIHYQTFNNIGDCIRICKELLLDIEQTKIIGENALDYYNKNVKPKNLIENHLRRCLNN